MSRIYNFGHSVEEYDRAYERMRAVENLQRFEDAIFEREELLEKVCECLPEHYYKMLPCVKYVYFADTVNTWQHERARIRSVLDDASYLPEFNDLDRKIYDLQDAIYFLGKKYFEKHCPGTEPEDIMTQCKSLLELLVTVSR